jgi:hypothetical protein
MAKYRKKPVEIEAVRIRAVMRNAEDDWSGLPEWVKDAYDRGDILFRPDGVEIRTLEGHDFGGPNDMLIRGVGGELYPCKPDIFEMNYEPAWMRP